MTERQKEAIRILNKIRQVSSSCALSEDEYFLLLEFVVGNEPQMTYIPYQPTITPQPLDPRSWEVMCNPESKEP